MKEAEKPSFFNVEYTDTFGGEANYSWVERKTIQVKKNASQAEIMRKAKAVVGLTNVKGRTNSYGDDIEFRPYKMCTVLFVHWTEHPFCELDRTRIRFRKGP